MDSQSTTYQWMMCNHKQYKCTLQSVCIFRNDLVAPNIDWLPSSSKPLHRSRSAFYTHDEVMPYAYLGRAIDNKERNAALLEAIPDSFWLLLFQKIHDGKTLRCLCCSRKSLLQRYWRLGHLEAAGCGEVLGNHRYKVLSSIGKRLFDAIQVSHNLLCSK